MKTRNAETEASGVPEGNNKNGSLFGSRFFVLGNQWLIPFIVYVVERQHAAMLCVDLRTFVRPCFRVEIVIAFSEVERCVKNRRYAYYDKVQRAENLALHGMPIKFMSHGHLAFCHSL